MSIVNMLGNNFDNSMSRNDLYKYYLGLGMSQPPDSVQVANAIWLNRNQYIAEIVNANNEKKDQTDEKLLLLIEE